MKTKIQNLWQGKIMIPLFALFVLISIASAAFSISLCSEIGKNNQVYSLTEPIRYDKAWDSMDM